MPKSKKTNEPISAKRTPALTREDLLETFVTRVVKDVNCGRFRKAALSIFSLSPKKSVVVAAHVVDQVQDSHTFLEELDKFLDG